MVEIELENLLKHALTHGVNLFLGAGFSVLANSADGKPLPLGSQLKSELITAFDLAEEDVQGLNLAEISAILESERRADFRRFLSQRLRVDKFSSKYKVLDSLQVRCIFTTNQDDLCYKIYEDSTSHYLYNVALKGAAIADQYAIEYVPLHGSVLEGDETLIFTTLEVSSAFDMDQDKWRYLTGQLQRIPTIFWGYNLGDAGVLQALNKKMSNLREQQQKWIVLREHNTAAVKYFKALDLNIIISNTDDFLDYLATVDKPPSAKLTVPKLLDLQSLFPDDTIPKLGSSRVPVRPLRDFYLGGAPYWDDIFNNRIYKTTHYSTVLDAINSGKHMIVHGLPASGKSTLLMQVAHGIRFDGHIMVCDPRTFSVEKAEFILMKLNGAPCLLFVDEFTNDIDAFTTLMRAPNTIVIGFDRTNSVDIVSHRLAGLKYNFKDVTELNQKDMQGIFASLPDDIRKQNLNLPRMERGAVASMYEIVELNLKVPALGIRYRTLLQQLQKQQDLHDLLVMISYVHSCRTPVSLDMVLSFLYGKVKDYQEAYGKIDNLGRLIVEYTEIPDDLLDGSQDYYVSRSMLVAEAIVREVDQASFRRVLVDFHRKVSPFRICRFDVFKRRAFDQVYMAKAFPKWEDGRDFYEEIFSRDGSAFVRQQGALYLSHKRRFSEAFAWIDEALLMTHYKIPSIRNSHAIILFKANIEKDEISTGDVRATLDESMRILSECYTYDQRKTYHALTFADQALQYWHRYGDQQAQEYLTRSLKWLTEERKRQPWRTRDINRLVQNIEDALR